MIEISISRELAAAHPGFMAGCAERGHAVEVFDSDGRDRSHETGRSGRTSPRFDAEAR